MKLPKTLYVRIEEPGRDLPFPLAFATLDEAVDGDGPTLVGTYKLVETQDMRKVVEKVARKR